LGAETVLGVGAAAALAGRRLGVFFFAVARLGAVRFAVRVLAFVFDLPAVFFLAVLFLAVVLVVLLLLADFLAEVFFTVFFERDLPVDFLALFFIIPSRVSGFG
jgi:hypothetical protein